MSIVKPWTFEAGKKARANEVNDDFDLLYSQVNSNISAIEQNSTDIDNLDLNKANIEGDSTKVFNVADATSNTHAVNKQVMMRSIGNVIDYINGLTIEVDTNSPIDTILVNPGSCYDSTHSEVLVLNNITSKQNLNQGASTTYYVYIVKNNNTTDIVLSQSSVGEGITGLFRQIGRYTTNSESEIDKIYFYGCSNYNDTLNNILTAIVPDYNNGISYTATNTNLEPAPCTCLVEIHQQAGNSGFDYPTTIYINGKIVGYTAATYKPCSISTTFLVKKGDILKCTNGRVTVYTTFYPLLGVDY